MAINLADIKPAQLDPGDLLTKGTLQDAFDSDVTTIDGGKITTGFIDASRIRTDGLIAENISSSSIIKGNRIEGAAIYGSVIKASYLDLDGELEVLTNYHITPAMYSANPSLYTDAIYMSGADEYRIPTSSKLYAESINEHTVAVGTTYHGNIKSYDSGNAGHNNKIVKKSGIHLTMSDDDYYFISAVAPDAGYKALVIPILRIGNTLGIKVVFDYNYPENGDYHPYSITSDYFSTINGTIVHTNGEYKSHNVTAAGMAFEVTVGKVVYGEATVVIRSRTGVYTIPSDIVGNTSLFSSSIDSSAQGPGKLSISNNITIDNML